MYNCDKLKSVKVPESVKSIGDYAFGFLQSEDETDDDGNYVSNKDDSFSIYGYSSSKAKKYASKSNIKFVSMEVDLTKVVIAVVGAAALIVIAAFMARSVNKKKREEELEETDEGFIEDEKPEEEKDKVTEYVKILDNGGIVHDMKSHSDTENKDKK